jgi:pyridoxine 5-phosphate synthase
MRARQKHQRLYVNVDHVATLRQARRGTIPDPTAAAAACVEAGADGITAHLREDRRHVQDDDVATLRNSLRTYFNLELACTGPMLEIAVGVRPDQATLVPERREEITTEGGLDLRAAPAQIRSGVARLREAGIRTSLFIDPDVQAVELARALGADAIELHTGRYSRDPGAAHTVRELQAAATRGAELGLAVHAGHGLCVENVAPVAAVHEIEELNIGHAIISRALFIGLHAAVREIREAMNAARGAELAPPAP